MNKKAYVCLADGFELIEALTPVDILRRIGVEVVLVSTNQDLIVSASNGVKISAECLLSKDLIDGDLLILPGGYPGYVNLRTNQAVISLAEYYLDHAQVCTICGGPTILGLNNLIRDYHYTCHHGVKHEMPLANYVDQNVVIDRNLISAKGAGLALDFSLALAKMYCNDEEYQKLLSGIELN